MKTKLFKLLVATLAGGLSMWIIAGLWHNLILPFFNENTHAHHDGLGLMLLAYFILAFLMAYLYSFSFIGNKPALQGLKLGLVRGLLWVLPHGLAMAGVHGTSVIYEFKNAAWHLIEQGIGGVIIGLVYSRIAKGK